MPNRIDLHIAMMMKRTRLQRGLEVGQVAKMMGFKSHVSVVRMEGGKQQFTAGHIYLLSCIFNVTPTFFFPAIKGAKITVQKREVIIKPKLFKVSNLVKL